MENSENTNPTSNNNELSFSGSGKEFFGIWIVNVLLTICTLGIYSAWAKVRTVNYFYGNTKLEGNSSFSYTANPVSILKGRIIAFVVLMAYTFMSESSPLLGSLIFILVALLVPFVIVSSMKFKMYNTEYRGLRFGFVGTVGEAYKIFFISIGCDKFRNIVSLVGKKSVKNFLWVTSASEHHNSTADLSMESFTKWPELSCSL